MELKELKEKSQAELNSLLADTREKLRDMNFRVSLGQLKTVREIREARVLIARVLTLLSQKKDNQVNI